MKNTKNTGLQGFLIIKQFEKAVYEDHKKTGETDTITLHKRAIEKMGLTHRIK